MLISRRIADLLEKAAERLAAGANPFHPRWLTENEVTFVECEQLWGLMAVAVRDFVKAADRAQAEAWFLSAAGSAGWADQRLARITAPEPRPAGQN